MPRRVLKGEVTKRIRELSADGASYRAIHRVLVDEFGKDAPRSDRTVSNIVRRWRQPEPQSAWSLARPDAAESASAVLPVIAAVLVRSEGERRFVTVSEARWISRIVRASPGIPPWVSYVLARECLRREAAKEFRPIDLYLALRPWTREGAATASRLGYRWIPWSDVAPENPDEMSLAPMTFEKTREED